MKTKRLLSAAIAAGLGLGLASGAQANIIDLFEQPPDTTGQTRQEVIDGDSSDTIGYFESYTDPDNTGSIIGNVREVFIGATAGAEEGNEAKVSVFYSTVRQTGLLDFSNDADVSSVAIVQWDGSADTANGVETTVDWSGSADDIPSTVPLQYLLGADLIKQEGCGSGCQAFVASILTADLGFTFDIGIYTDADTFSILTAASLGVPPQPQLNVFPFSYWSAAGDFTDGLFSYSVVCGDDGCVNLHDVGALRIVLYDAVDLDMRIDSITKVPEPGSLALLGIGGLMAGFAARRRKAFKA
jgi:hypothetical protein